MPVLNINGKRVDVDIENELRQYSWERDRWTGDKLIACSPFRTDSSPSFFVDLTSGGWADSGGIGEYEHGNFMALIGYLRSITPYEAGEYLIDKYGALYDLSSDDKPIKLETPKLLNNTATRRYLDGSALVQAVSPYIKSRGISDEVQRQFAIGYGEGHRGFTAIPWHTVEGRLANVKYRSTSDKQFFYESNATPVSTLVYGLDVAKKYSEVVIVEGEIDALSWWTAGVPAIALGGAHINDEQAELITRQGFKRVYLGGDNDNQGRKLNRLIAKKIRGYAEMYTIDYGKQKDANDVLKRHGIDGLRVALETATQVEAINLQL